jgi:hypothetical protein
MIAWVRELIEQRPYGLALSVALGALCILFYGILALGLIGEEGDSFDRMYLIVLGICLVGALATLLRPQGMAFTMVAAALAQATITVIALAAGKHRAPATSVPELVGLNAFFIALFLASAWLFWRAARDATPLGARG